jgi:vanillate O-demethylase monooxygenase subunit
MAYLLNRWYAAAWSGEVAREPFMRVLFDKPVLFYRTESGDVTALSNVCPHRFAPLNRGKLFGDAIRCPYHGLRFGPDGRCVQNPIGKGLLPAKAQLTRYATIEAHGVIWIWHGPAPADATKLVPFDFLDEHDRYDFVDGYIAIDANYALVSDNLLDLSHAEFLHPNLSNPGANQRVRFTAQTDGETVRALNARPGEPPTVLLRAALGDGVGDTIDMWSNVTWNPPALLCVEVGGTARGAPKEAGVNTMAAHLITPETAVRSHYFWKLGRTYRRGDPDFSARVQAMVSSAFVEEDKPIIEAQQHNMGDVGFEQLDPVYLESDGAGARARRIMNRLLAENAADALIAPV